MLVEFLGHCLSPPRCAACNGSALARTAVFCASCAATVERAATDPAYSEHERTALGHAYGEYGGALSVAVRRLKYENCPHLARPLGSLLRQVCRERTMRADVVVPVPLHPRRLVERGYNQAALLARHVARELGAVLVTHGLARAVDTRQQAEQSREQRHTNVAQAFVVTAPSTFVERSVLLVDDVATTGATLAACRAALLFAGAGSVTSVVVARTARS